MLTSFNQFSLKLDFRVADDLHFSEIVFFMSDLRDMCNPFNPFFTPDFRVADDLHDFHPGSKKGKRLIEDIKLLEAVEISEKSSEKRSCQGLTTHSTSTAVLDLVNVCPHCFFRYPLKPGRCCIEAVEISEKSSEKRSCQGLTTHSSEKSSEKRSCQGLTTHSTSTAVLDLVRVCPHSFFGYPYESSGSCCYIRSATLPFHQWCNRQLAVKNFCHLGRPHVKYNETGDYYTILRKFAEDKKYPTTKCERYYHRSIPTCLISTRGSSRWGDWEADKIAHDDVPEDLLKEMYLSSSLQPNRFAPFELIDNRRAGWDSFRCEFAVGRHGILLEPYSGFRACFSVVVPAVQCPECADIYNLKETDSARVTHIPFIGLTTSSTFPGGNWLALMWKMNGTILFSKRSGNRITTNDPDLHFAHGYVGAGCEYYDLHKQEFAHTCEFLVCCTTIPRVYFFIDYEECQYIDFPKLFYGQEMFPCFPMSLCESIQTPIEFKHQFTQTGGKPFDV